MFYRREVAPDIAGRADAGVVSIVRTFRNESAHPTGKIIDREQAYVLLCLFIPYCRKMYQLMQHLG